MGGDGRAVRDEKKIEGEVMKVYRWARWKRRGERKWKRGGVGRKWEMCWISVCDSDMS